MKYKPGVTDTPPRPWRIKHEKLVDANDEPINLASRNILALIAANINLIERQNGTLNWACNKCISTACIC